MPSSTVVPVLLQLLLAQEGAADEAEPPPAITYDVVMSSDRDEAAGACFYNSKKKDWECTKRALQFFRLRGQGLQNNVRGAVVRVQPVLAKSGCVASVRIVMNGHAEELKIDWDRVALAVDGVALQAVPGFTRRMTSSLPQRSTTVPPGMVLDETVHPVSDACIGPARPAKGSTALTSLYLPFSVGGREEVLQWSLNRQWESATEGEAYLALPGPLEPVEPTAPTASRFPPNVCLTLWAPGIWCGCSALTLLGGILLDSVGLVLLLTKAATSYYLGAGIGLAFVIAAVFLLPALAPAPFLALVDLIWLGVWAGGRAGRERLKDKYNDDVAQYREDVEKVAAWRAKRRAAFKGPTEKAPPTSNSDVAKPLAPPLK